MSSPILVRWESRLENWAAWTISGSSQFSAGVSGIYKGLDRYRAEYVGPRPLIGDATDVDALIHRLSDEHRRALVARYVWTGTTQDRARSLGCHVDTLRDRTRAAIFRLDDLDQARKRPAGARAEHADAYGTYRYSLTGPQIALRPFYAVAPPKKIRQGSGAKSRR